MEKPIGVAVLGLGNVGREVVRIIEESAPDLAARIGAPLELRGVAVRRVADDRGVPVAMLTDNVEDLVSRDDVDIVVEAVFENMDLKKSTFAELTAVTRPDAILASNTSGLSVASILIETLPRCT
mgnify:CR=1 FL=1